MDAYAELSRVLPLCPPEARTAAARWVETGEQNLEYWLRRFGVYQYVRMQDRLTMETIGRNLLERAHREARTKPDCGV